MLKLILYTCSRFLFQNENLLLPEHKFIDYNFGHQVGKKHFLCEGNSEQARAGEGMREQ